MTANSEVQRGEVLVAIMNSKRDLAILQEKHWYRIPVDTAPKRWPPRWLAFYQTKVFGDEAYAVNYYGRVRDIRVVPRSELFPDEFPNPKSGRQYFQVRLQSLDSLPQPIFSRRLRRVVFIPTTWAKFTHAAEINDLWDESPLEDRLWAEFERLEIEAERQWDTKIGSAWYKLDFALFCEKGKIDVETDGDTWHAVPKRIPEDNRRDNDLASDGWYVLRFNGHQIREQMPSYCIPNISDMINRLGGQSEQGLVARTFYQTSEGLAQQLTLLEDGPEYDLD
jgi:very-short-patch-repair endonuclease